jgi:hypothetical protein
LIGTQLRQHFSNFSDDITKNDLVTHAPLAHSAKAYVKMGSVLMARMFMSLKTKFLDAQHPVMIQWNI